MPSKPRFRFETIIDSKEPSRSRRTTDLNRPDLDQHHLDAGAAAHARLDRRTTVLVTQMLGQLGVQHRLQDIPW